MVNKKEKLEILINNSSIISIENKKNLRKNLINLSNKEVDDILYTLSKEKNIIKNLLKNWCNKSNFDPATKIALMIKRFWTEVSTDFANLCSKKISKLACIGGVA